MSEQDRQRYASAAHAMPSGVAMKMNYKPSETEPKHLRVGVNAAMADAGGLVTLLIAKGVFTRDEYEKAIADSMEREKDAYEAHLSMLLRTKITLR